nr:caspase recruitment domain-containing protein 11 isoform X1 [Crassostrea gigas]XP_034312956.1 caspase recruitment domain-containing protein 11 isoform X1 [Crassostrea gigas]XP_034312957.1 caspase recruitment domain-containing protein 11 isoform X1 [Crassostrea gigas]XP_034312958.1 caspase recruitment domain-containing protein 11 isoform X1 [Crassostrea gigas]XP_034312959.1 caspase recruitment domain-containing protein 11 isoform X1 [Crassostrea gigas]
MSDDEEKDIFEELIERKRYKIVKYINAQVFFDKLREVKVLSMDDTQEISSKPTRRQQAGYFLDILQTKGDNGVKKFLEILEWEYPHVFKDVTNKDAREPPTDYLKHRESVYAGWLYKLPELAESLKNDYEHKKDLNEKFQEMKEVMKIVQDNNLELERENLELQEKQKMLLLEKNELETQLGHCFREKQFAQDKSVNFLESIVEYQKEISNLKDSLREVRHERDACVKQIENMMDNFSKNKAENSEARRKSYSMTQLNTEKIYDRQNSAQEFEITILKEKLEQEQENCSELNQQLVHVMEELDHTQAQLRKTKSNCDKLIKEVETKDKWLEEKRKRIDEYFKVIERLEEEKKRLEEERNREQKKVKDVEDKSRTYFTKIYQLENMLEALKSENEKLKIQYNRISSGSSIAEEVIASDKFPVMHDDLYPDDEPTYRSPDQNYAWDIYQKVSRSPRRDDSMKPEVGGSFRLNDVVEPQPFNYSIIPVHTLLKEQEKHSNPDISEQFEGEGTTTGASASNTLSSDTSEDTDTELMGFNVNIRELPLKWRPPKSTPPSAQMDKQCTYKVILPVLDEKLKITGGNFTGIFILEVNRKLESGLCVGDQVISVQLLKSDYSCVSKKEMRTLTLMEARAAFLFENQRDNEKDLEITIKRTAIEEYESIRKWMETNKSTGDYFYVRAGAAVKEKVPDCLPIKKGDILRVTNTYYVKGDRKYWKVCPYDRQNEKWGKEGIIPSDIRRLFSNDRRGAFRARSLFVRVLPMKASSRLPVLMYGPENIISSAQSLIVDDSPDYLCYNVDKGRTVDILRHCINTGKHCMMKEGPRKIEVCIVIVIHTDGAAPEVIKSIFGVDKATEYKYNISDDIICETITVGENGVNDKQSFLRAFYEQVQKGQDRMFWCTSSQLDESIVTQFQDYLGRESGDQRAQSQDSGSEGSLLRSTSNPC